MTVSSGRLRTLRLRPAELHALDILASGPHLRDGMPQTMADACEALCQHGLAQHDEVHEYGRGARQVFEITFEGQTYLIRHLKNHNGSI